MLRHIKAFFARLFPKRTVLHGGRVYDALLIGRLAHPFPRFDGEGDPPRGHWKPAHKRTRSRFKAEFTCPSGHGMTLKSHVVMSDGLLIPSVVCRHSGCAFHEWARLQDWDFGELT